MSPTPIARAVGALGLVLPAPSAVAGNYVPTREAFGLLTIAGQIGRAPDGGVHAGTLGLDLEVADGVKAAQAAALALLAVLDRALDGDLDRLVGCLGVTGFVRSVPDFHDHPKVMNGASDLLVQVLGERGRHARTAVGVASLPQGAAVEINATFAVTPRE